MKKTSALFLMALLLFTTRSNLFAQANDCYAYQCPTNIFAPCEGAWGARVSYTVYATNTCDPANPPTVTYSIPPGSIFPPGTNIVCATIQIPGIPPRNCCWQVIVDKCCSTNCIEVLCPRDITVPCTQTPFGFGAMLNLPQPTATNHCGDLVASTLIWKCYPPPPSPSGPQYFPPGTNHVVWCLVDSAGNYIDCCCFEVIVINCPAGTTDQCQPQIICPTDVSMQCRPDGSGAIVFFPPPQVTDPCHLVIGTNSTYTSGSVFPNGKTTVAWCITWRNPATGALITECCCFDVIVRCCPTNCTSRLDCPTNIVVDCPGPNGTPLNYTVTGGNNCQPTQIVCDPPPGSIIYGPTNVCCRLFGNGVVLAQCCFKVNVIDNIPPQIDCPPSLTFVSSNCQPVQVALPVIGAHDNCDPNPVVHCDPNTSVFPCGVTTVVCTATDYNGNSTNCTFDVTVICDNRTRIRCPDDITIRCAPTTGATVTYSIQATNPCTNIVSTGCNPPSGSIFPPGTTGVCCWAIDGFGASNRCCFKVTVLIDDVPPTISCPSNIVVISPNCTPMDVQYPPPTATDDCQLDHVDCNPPSGSPFPVGTTTVTCCAFDKAGNKACCTFTVTVRCNDCVKLYCPSNIVVDCAPAAGAVVTYNAYATNNCTGAVIPLTCNPPSGSTFPIGVTTVCCTNTSATVATPNYCCFDVTVRPDTQPPTITCPSNIVVISPNCTSMDVQYPAPIATDNCQLDYVKCDPPSGSPFPVGVTTVTCCAYDKAGNSNCCNFTVTVRCQDCVKLYCPSNIVVDCAGPNGLAVTYNAYVSNICTGTSAPANCSPPSGSIFPIGTTTVCCTNTATPGTAAQICCFDVTVRPDTVPPTITCPSNVVVFSPNCTSMDVQYPPPTASDNCKLDHVVCNPPSGSPFPVGVTTVTCCAWDTAGNSNCCNFTVTLRCNDCTKLVCPSNIVVDCAGPNGLIVTYNAYVSNICTGGWAPANCSPPSGSTFPPGVTTVCCTNNAALGTAAQICCFDVTVRRDTLPPDINCPSNIFILCAKPHGAVVTWKVGARDDCDPNPTVTCIPPSGSLFPIGCTNVTCVATDHSGNANTCTFKVCVLKQGCYLFNPSFEVLLPNLPAPNNCGDPINFAAGWSALSGTPDLWRPPFASLVPGNCRGREKPCDGTNYAGFEGGYTTSGGFVTEEMMGTLVAPLNNNGRFRLTACLSLAESSPGPVFVEFVLANSANLAQQQVIHQVWVSVVNGWLKYAPPCFTVPDFGTWDRLIIRMAKVSPTTHPYQVGYAYVDNVNICCCQPFLNPPVLTDTTVTVSWNGRGGQLQGSDQPGDPTAWHDITTPVDYDPETDTSSTKMPIESRHLFYQVIGTLDPTGCTECAGGGGGAGGM